jgi:hypothetical protein
MLTLCLSVPLKLGIFFRLEIKMQQTRLLLSCRAQTAEYTYMTVLCRWYCLLCCAYVNKFDAFCFWLSTIASISEGNKPSGQGTKHFIFRMVIVERRPPLLVSLEN